MDIRPTATVSPTGGILSDRQVQLIAAATARPAAAPAEPVASVQQPSAVPDMEQLGQAVKGINKRLQEASPPQNVEFAIDSDSSRVIVKVVDQKTREVLRQMPSEEALEIAKALDLSKGLLISQKA